jgi:hypothetical protein
MAFNEINEYSIELYKEYKRLDEVYKTTHDGRMISEKQLSIFNCMIQYYITVLSKAKFKSQREKMKELITELDPGFAKGFFKTK